MIFFKPSSVRFFKYNPKEYLKDINLDLIDFG